MSEIVVTVMENPDGTFSVLLFGYLIDTFDTEAEADDLFDQLGEGLAGLREDYPAQKGRRD